MNKDMHKFRVYCEFANGNKGYVYFDLAEGLKAALVDIGCDFATTRFLSDVEQCTGLEDKHGVLIYENDIVATSGHYKPAKYQMKWGDCCWELWHKDRYVYTVYENMFQSLEVIGNIYYTPELLEGGNE